jgi:anti-sigma factor RsiW
MTCRELTSFIGDYLAGELDARIATAFERHLKAWPNCVQYLTDYQRAVDLGQRVCADADAEATGVPDDLLNAILAARRASSRDDS